MSDSDPEKKIAPLEPELRHMKIEDGPPLPGVGDGAVKVEHVDENPLALTPSPPLTIPAQPKSDSTSQSPTKSSPSTTSSPSAEDREETVGGDITLKMEPGKAPKLSRTASKKIIFKPPPLYLDLPDATKDATDTFIVLPECTYGNKSLGTTDHALECDCSEEWDPETHTNNACGEDSDCINRATKMECVGDCSCGRKCQNQRFQRRQYADVAVIKTEKKGFGLRANTDLRPGDFIFEYIGEVIDERTFRRRMIQYDQEGIKHFYFMSLTKGEFVDATKKGNLGRFCNHSCNPNCYVDKWVVGDKLRMGIFAERKIKAGEELVFNYNVDRYGADPQPCYCGEPNCTGFIGGRTQTDNATKLSHATIEALGIDDSYSWETAVAKKPRKKKATEDDEEYVNDIMPKSLEESGVNKVMAALRQCTEKWVAVKLLSRLQGSIDDEKVAHRVIRVHGYEILKSTITAWKDDVNVILQALDILHRLPRITRNKIQDSKIEETIESLKSFEDERVQSEAARLLEAWSKLEVAYRIPRMKRDPNAATPLWDAHFDRRDRKRERSRSRSKSPVLAAAPKGPAASGAPTAPRAFVRNGPFFNGPRPPRPRPQFNALPAGWFQATSADTGAIYYYNSSGVTQWTRPTLPAQAPPPPPKAKTNEQKLQEIISSITQNVSSNGNGSASGTPKPADEQKSEKPSKSEKWKSLPLEKQQKLYEGTLHPHVMSVVAHYRKKLDKEDLKRLSKDVAQKLVRGDYKHGKVKDPTAKLDHKHEKTVKKFVKDYMDKAVEKKAIRDKERAARHQKKSQGKPEDKSSGPSDTPKTPVTKESPDADQDVPDVSYDDVTKSPNASPGGSPSSDLKRKREDDDDVGSPKKSRTDDDSAPPPPPPPPPASDMPMDVDHDESTSFEHLPQAPDLGAAASLEDLGLEGVKSEGTTSPIQLATPPTTTNGSCKHESNDDAATEQSVRGSREVSVEGGGA
ncbi:uncharacterized protein EI97DRAFT_260417 [Westerdykella ornata]|uniref:Histone-lysine N-methyltransferase, H3 lysine-36 specific n=1 Tax=Westerdykella ornata TaxID=318751 RepID=A0A6A6J6F5_WESOR|nr:uncharacterized protein EI97DRAFT_260417 [Westerdykella ornata]KAF2271723.1 hypothetical protein EI97DRAFT_260417 [Westerdykella ornata]